MNKLNNKGLTMIELIISIALISVVMIFLYRLLANVQYDKDIEFFASKNQEQKIEIVNYIQGLLRFSDKDSYIYNINFTDDIITFNINDNGEKQYQMIVQDEKTLVVRDTDTLNGGILRSWTIEQGTMGKAFCRASVVKEKEGALGVKEIKPGLGESVPVECTIPVYTINNSNVKMNNNTLDDIMIALLITGK